MGCPQSIVGLSDSSQSKHKKANNDVRLSLAPTGIEEYFIRGQTHWSQA